MSNICPSTNMPNVAVRVKVHSLSGAKLADRIETGQLINFDVKAQMEERERRTGLVIIGFALSVRTKPNIAKFDVEGTTALEGNEEEIKSILQADPETQIPPVFQSVYQQVFMGMYLLATFINAPCPPANLLSSNQQQIPNVQMTQKASAVAEETLPPSELDTSPKIENPTQPPMTRTTPLEGAKVSDEKGPAEATAAQIGETTRQETKAQTET